MTFERNAKGLLGTKLGMTQVWDENNRVVPVTVVKAASNVVTQVRTPEIDGYSAIQLAFGQIDPRKVTKPMLDSIAKAGGRTAVTAADSATLRGALDGMMLSDVAARLVFVDGFFAPSLSFNHADLVACELAAADAKNIVDFLNETLAHVAAN